MHISQALALANIMMRIETWLFNTIGFIRYIYDISVKGLYAQVKVKCFDESKRVFKIYRFSYIDIQKNDTCDKRTKKTLVVI
jgi:hypothetical protein